MMNDPLSAILSNIVNSERRGKRIVRFKPVSKVALQVLKILNASQFLGETEVEKDNRGGIMTVHLLGNISNCGAVTPRHAVPKEKYEKFEKRFLPAKDFGILIVSTSQGIMNHAEAKKKGLGGKLLAYCY